MYVDLSKTVAAPYSQGNELFFGQNAGQQCVVMSLYCLIPNTKQGISSVNGLIQIMNIGNQLHSSLSQLARQSYLMQIDYLQCFMYLLLTMNWNTVKVTLVVLYL